MANTRRYYYLSDPDWKQIEIKIKEFGFTGKGRHERFMELLARNKVIILFGNLEAIELKNLFKSSQL